MLRSLSVARRNPIRTAEEADAAAAAAILAYFFVFKKG